MYRGMLKSQVRALVNPYLLVPKASFTSLLSSSVELVDMKENLPARGLIEKQGSGTFPLHYSYTKLGVISNGSLIRSRGGYGDPQRWDGKSYLAVFPRRRQKAYSRVTRHRGEIS